MADHSSLDASCSFSDEDRCGSNVLDECKWNNVLRIDNNKIADQHSEQCDSGHDEATDRLAADKGNNHTGGDNQSDQQVTGTECAVVSSATVAVASTSVGSPHDGSPPVQPQSVALNAYLSPCEAVDTLPRPSEGSLTEEDDSPTVDDQVDVNKPTTTDLESSSSSSDNLDTSLLHSSASALLRKDGYESHRHKHHHRQPPLLQVLPQPQGGPQPTQPQLIPEPVGPQSEQQLQETEETVENVDVEDDVFVSVSDPRHQQQHFSSPSVVQSSLPELTPLHATAASAATITVGGPTFAAPGQLPIQAPIELRRQLPTTVEDTPIGSVVPQSISDALSLSAPIERTKPQHSDWSMYQQWTVVQGHRPFVMPAVCMPWSGISCGGGSHSVNAIIRKRRASGSVYSQTSSAAGGKPAVRGGSALCLENNNGGSGHDKDLLGRGMSLIPLNGGGGGATGVGTSKAMSHHAKRWSVAGAGPEITLLRMKLDDVQRELCELQAKHEAMTLEYQDVLNELQCCRDAKGRLENELHESKIDVIKSKSEYELLIQQKQLSERQVLDLQLKLQAKQAEVEELKRQCRDILDGEPNRSELSASLMQEYEHLVDERNKLKGDCQFYESQVTELKAALHMAQEELRQVHVKRDCDLEQERMKTNIIEERQMALYQQLHKMAQERDLLRNENEMLKQQLQDICSDVTRNLNIREKLEEDIHILHRQHNGVLSEYHRVMSERDTVLKENERLAEEKTNLSKKIKANESNCHALIEQLKTLELQMQGLREERLGLQQQLKSCEDIIASTSSSHGGRRRRRLPTQQQVQAQADGSPLARQHFGSGSNGSDSKVTNDDTDEELVAVSGATTVSRSKEMASGKRGENEYDDLRRLLDSLKEELTLSRQEVDSSKQQRDWALSERQRIVSERESMRTMCDNLRRERDDAISKLAAAIRDLDVLQRQKEQAERDMKKIKEKFEIETRIRNTDCSSPSHSRDSAIDADMAEWEVETLELNMNNTQKTDELGIELRGGREDPICGQEVPIYVKSVSPGCRLENALRVYDCIMQVNNIDVALMERRSVMDILRNSSSVKMVIKRRRLIGMKLISVPLAATADGTDIGIVFEDGVYVSKIKTGSPAAKAGHLAVGDRLVYMNDIPVQNRCASNVEDIIRGSQRCGLVLAVMKSPPMLSPMTPAASFPSHLSPSVVSSRTVNSSSLANTGQNVVCEDVSVQTMNPSEVLASSKRHESLLDKVHDKIFGKTDKKATVRASATIPVESVDTVSNYTVVDRVKTGAGSSAEQQVLQQLDSILEASEKEYENKGLLRVANADRAAGGTWPKYRPSPITPSNVGIPTAAVVHCQKATDAAGQRQTPAAHAAGGAAGGSSAHGTTSRAAAVAINAKSPPLVDSGGTQRVKIRSSENRPFSYHPSNNKMRYSVISSTSSSPISQAALASRHSTSCSADTHPSSIPLVRPVSVHGTQNQQVSYHYSPICNASLLEGGAFTAGQPAAMVKYHQQDPHHQMQVAHAVPVALSNNHYGHLPSSPFAYRRGHFGSSGGGGQTEEATSLDQDLDQRSVTSQSSGSRPGVTQMCEQSSSKCLLGSSAGSTGTGGAGGGASSGAEAVSPRSVQSPVNYSSNSKSSRWIPIHSVSPDCFQQVTRLSQGDVRKLCIEKRSSHEGLGISIASSGNGVFVSSVSENSLAAKHGLQVGDQLLEVCGINMRSANFQHASNVLSQLGRSEQITLMVQYNPDRYMREMSDYHSANSTPRATPNSIASSSTRATGGLGGGGGGVGSGGLKGFLSHESSLQSTSAQQSHELLSASQHSVHSEPRFVFYKRVSDDWGFTLIGGNAIGIFIDDVKAAASPGGSDGLRAGDQILEFDGVNFRKLTLEQAMYELGQRPVGIDVSVLVQNNESMYQKCKRGAGDSFYVRVTVDRQAENTDELSFKAGDILRVDNTVFNGVQGLWRAWLVDQEGRERSCGIIPSKIRFEEEFIFKRSGSEISATEGGVGFGSEGGGSRRGTIRRSLKFIRRSSRSAQHQRTPSKESRELNEMDLPMVDDLYQRVERLDYKQKRPVLILGAAVDVFISRLLEDYPKLFVQCVPECVKPMPVPALEQGLQRNIYVDYRKRDKLFEITRVAVVKELIDKGYHCILHVNPAAIERLHRLQIYPVVIFIKFKNSKHIKDICEDRLTSKQAKELFEQANKIELEYHNLFSAVIQCPHHSVKYICQQIACAVEHEQKKTLWIISGETF